ncbi:30S ribosomal protein S14 [Aquipuribacter nitratireducens]|uniref:Small ribosomal subunit protein uS14 n=1 Tax=Aquipuribacter nitratireducens TaxID=650104 RepID=A0ABW0GLM7_9MICO
MATTAKIAKDRQRRVVVERWAERRAVLKREISAPGTVPERREQAVRELARLPRDGSRTRLRNRDVVDGRPRAVLRTFGLSRIRLREMAHAGELPGVTKASW